MTDKPVFKLDSNRASALLGVSLILLGILFLVGRYFDVRLGIELGHYGWPFFIILPGALLFFISFAFERQAGITLAMIGGVVTMTGAILLVQNTFDLFASWAYAWALVAPTSIGLAKLIYGSIRRLDDQVRSGLNLIGIGLAIFILGGFFFEAVIGINGFRLGTAWLCWPGLVIGLGIVLLLSNVLPRRNHASAILNESPEESRNE